MMGLCLGKFLCWFIGVNFESLFGVCVGFV